MKQLLELSQIVGNEYELRVTAYAMSPAETKEARTELDDQLFRYTHIDADLLHAELVGTYDAVIASMKQLEKQNWVWRETS